MNPIKKILSSRKSGGQRAIPSYCTSNPLVLEACMETAGHGGHYVLVEGTANQVNQFGGYTGMKPEDFVKYVRDIADKAGLAQDHLLIGGDHLGPLVWSAEPEEEAMAKASELVRQFAAAGVTKIHLDTSMRLGSDPTDEMLSTETIARRGAILYGKVVEGYNEYKASHPEAEFPVIIIGSEVPIPGGSQEAEDSVAVTKPEAFEDTVAVYHKVFAEAGYADAFEHIIAVVVQPGVEFGDSSLVEYDHAKAASLIARLEKYPELVFEGHSTDYQSEKCLTMMAEDGIGILKVGPALTFALREGLYQLEEMERVLYPQSQCSHLSDVINSVMLENPSNWRKHYSGTEEELYIKRMWSYSDRIRYYIGEPVAAQAIDRLFDNINKANVPLSMLHQFMPRQYDDIRAGILKMDARELVKRSVGYEVLKYEKAAGNA